MTDPEKRVMVVIPHPDDAEINCAGTIASWLKEGREAIYVICTNGDKGSSDPEITSERLAKIREQEQQEAARILGVGQVIFLGYPDGELEDTPAFRGELVRLVRQHHPDVVMTDDPYRRYWWWHRDHRITGRVTLDAILPYARDRLSYPDQIADGLQPHKVKEVYLWGSEEPNTFIDISETFSIKLAALGCHASQVGQDFESLKKRIEERARKLGEIQGIPLAEAFRRIELPP